MLSLENLHKYQAKAKQFILSNKFCALWLGLGLGKTAITLAAIEELINGMEVKKVLIVGPLRVCNSVWKQEAQKWNFSKDIKFSICTGSAHQRRKCLMAKADVYLINRENVVWAVKHFGKKWPFDMVVLDEASSFKSSSAKRWKALKSVRPYISRMVQLTGTPASNGLVDLWPQLYLLDLGQRLGRTKTAFLQRFFQSDFMGYKFEPRPGADKQIHGLVADLTLSLQAEDYLDLPMRIDTTVKVSVPEAVMDQYKALESEFILALGDGTDVEAFNAAALSNKLLQFSQGHVYYDETKNFHILHDAKLEALKDIVEDNSGEPMLVAYNYKSDLARIKAALPEAVVMDKQQSTIDRWNRGEIPVLLVHPASAGHGLNLQAGGALLIFFGLCWSLENYDQLCGRLHRQGQTRPVRVIHIVAENMLDEKVLNVLGGKARTQKELLQALKKELL
jgi:SNF2 family DNA or RNA helicase